MSIRLPSEQKSDPPELLASTSPSRDASGKLDNKAILALTQGPIMIGSAFLMVFKDWSKGPDGPPSTGMTTALRASALICVLWGSYLLHHIYAARVLQIIFVRCSRAVSMWRSGDKVGAKQEMKELIDGEKNGIRIWVAMYSGLIVLWIISKVKGS